MTDRNATPRDVLDFWLGEVGEKGWYAAGAELDGRVRGRFLPTWEAAMEGRLALWLTGPLDALAYLILLDQFPRNMFRGDPRSFASDRHARAAAKTAISRGWDLKVPVPERQFFYMPLEHSENLVDQDRAFGYSWRGCPRMRSCSFTPARTASRSAALAAFPRATRCCGGRARRRSRSSWPRRLRRAGEEMRGSG
jgi:uncharacterized protein (DUF924 family)